MSMPLKNGSDRRWREVRAAVLERDGYQCRAHDDGWCAPGRAAPHECKGSAPQVGGCAHHTIGRHTGYDPTYIVASCRSCNLAIGKPSNKRPTIEVIDDW